MSVWASVPCYAIQEEHPHRLCGLGSSAAPTSRSIVPGSPKAVASEKEKAPPMSQGTGRPLGSQPLSQLLEIRPPPACLSSLCGKSTTLILKQPKRVRSLKAGGPEALRALPTALDVERDSAPHGAPLPTAGVTATVPVGSYRALGDVYASRGRGVSHLHISERDRAPRTLCASRANVFI